MNRSQSQLSLCFALTLSHCSTTPRVSDTSADAVDAIASMPDVPAVGVDGASDAGGIDAIIVPNITAVFGTPTVFATHPQLVSYGFAFGPSDGEFGAIATASVDGGAGDYVFYGTAGSNAGCTGTPNAKGVYTFRGTLDHVTGGNGCTRLFGPGAAPAGWAFDRNYAGGGQVMRFQRGVQQVWLMSFHGETWWVNPGPTGPLCNNVNCFYSALGLAISTDGGVSFHVVGETLQPNQPLQYFQGGGRNMHVGYGSLILADANGRHLDNPPPNPDIAYVYLAYADLMPGAPGNCNDARCPALARAPYNAFLDAALSTDPTQIASVFHKYYAPAIDPWSEPGTSGVADLSAPSGRFTPLWNNNPGDGEVLYDRDVDAYIYLYQYAMGIQVRVSADLIHWSAPIASYSEPGRFFYYPALLGDTGDPTIGGTAPRVYYSSFVSGSFPNYAMSVFQTTTLMLSRNP